MVLVYIKKGAGPLQEMGDGLQIPSLLGLDVLRALRQRGSETMGRLNVSDHVLV